MLNRRMVWLVYDDADIEKNKHYIQMYEDECRKRSMDIRLIRKSSLYRALYQSLDIPLPDIAVNRSRDAQIGAYLERHGVFVFNHSVVTKICNDKGKTWEYLRGKGIPMMETAVFRKEKNTDGTFRVYETWHQNKKPEAASQGFSRQLLQSLSYNDVFALPLVVKSCGGHGGREVFLVHGRQEFFNACAQIQEDRIVVQRAADTPGRDLRVYVIGNEILAAILRESKDDFRSNYSLGGKASVHRLTEEETALVRKVMQYFDFGLVGIDLIYDHGRPVLNEIEDAVGARMLYQCTDIDLVGRYIDDILKKIE